MNENLEKKFELFEKQNKRYKTYNTILMTILFSIALYGFQQKIKFPDFELPSTIEAERFVVKGSNGKVAEFGLVNENEAMLSFYQEDGKVYKLSFGLNNGKAFIAIPGEKTSKFYLTEQDNHVTMRLASDKENGEASILLDVNELQPFVSLKKGSDTNNKTNDYAYFTNFGTKIIIDSLYLTYGRDFAFNTQNNKNLMLPLPGSFGTNVYTVDNVTRKFYYSSGFDIANKNSYVEVYNPSSNSSASLKVIQNLPGLVGIKENKLRYLLFIDEFDRTSMKIHDKDGNLRTVIGGETINVGGNEEKKDESNILLFNEKGSLLESIPSKK